MEKSKKLAKGEPDSQNKQRYLARPKVDGDWQQFKKINVKICVHKYLNQIENK